MNIFMSDYRPPSVEDQRTLQEKLQKLGQLYDALDRARGAMEDNKNYKCARDFGSLIQQIKVLRATLPKLRVVREFP